MKAEVLKELLLQSLEHEKGGVKVYETALRCVVRDDLREEWEEYLGQTLNHVDVLTKVVGTLGIDSGEGTPGQKVVRHVGSALVQAMEMALAAGDKGAAQLVACVEDQEDEHLYHTKGWCRELWIEALGMKAVLPPPEEVHHVKTAIGAAKAEQASAKTR